MRTRQTARKIALYGVFALFSTAVYFTLPSAAQNDNKGLVEPSVQVDLEAIWRLVFSRPKILPAPKNNPQSPQKVRLGSKLFSDTRLSRDDDRSCASCHLPDRGFGDGLPKALSLDGIPMSRNTPPLYNLAFSSHFFWDGRASSLEEQARIPIEHPDEMAGDLAKVVKRLTKDRQLVRAFSAAFPARPAISENTLLQALAAYERSLVSKNSRFDQWMAGEDGALTKIEKRGFALFVGKAGCVSCHGGWRFTDDEFHDTGLASKDPGRGGIAGGIEGLASFKTPGLRELAHSAPYMHDGSLATLAAVIDHYSGGFINRNSLSSSQIRDLRLSMSEKAALIAFLLTLTAGR